MNYIRFWQASGESEKTAIRVRTRLQQMTAEGVYTGGPVPFGYRLVDNGRKNKKGKCALDLAIDPVTAPFVLKLFTMVADEGYGSHQLAEWLNRQGFKTSTGSRFHSSNVLRILKNEIYRGFMVGRLNPDSHFCTDWRVTFSFSAKTSCEKPLFIRNL